MNITDENHKLLFERRIEPVTKLLSVCYEQVAGMPLLLERWSADGVRGRSADFLTESVVKMNDAAVRMFLIDEAGVAVNGATTVTRGQTHTFLNYDFEAL